MRKSKAMLKRWKKRQAKRKYQMAQRIEKNRVAEAVHLAVCDWTGGDGFGHCILYAVAGAHLTSRLTGQKYFPVAGSLALYPDPERQEGITFDPKAGGGLLGGEFHAWIIGPLPPGFREGSMTAHGIHTV